MLQADHDLRADLIRWRRETALQNLGPAIVRTYGAKVFISDQIVERLVVCAHARKLAGVDDVVRETGWRRDQAEKHSVALFKVIHTHTPPPMPPPPVPSTGGADDDSRTTQVGPNAGPTTLARPRRRAKCSKCHQEGHISTYCITLLARHNHFTCCLEGSNRSCPVRIASRTYNDHALATPADENAVPLGGEGSTGLSGNPLPPRPQPWLHYRQTQRELTTHVPHDIPVPSSDP